MALLINQATPQDADAANTLGSAVRAFKTAILDIFTITDNTTITNAPFSISTAGLVTILRSPFTVTGHAASGGAKALIVTPGAHTAVTAEVIDLDFQAHTNTITGTYATQRFANFGQPTMTATAAYTITTAATVNIAGPCHPTGAGPVTITNDYALRLEQATVTASAATTITTCAALVIEGAPIRGTNVTITNTYAELLKDSGAKTLASIVSRIENTATSSTDSIDKVGLSITSTGTWNGASANNIGIDIGAITGGTNNYSLRCAHQIKSTLATGTAPFAVDSTTVVTNLNADLVDGKNPGSASGIATLDSNSKVVEDPASASTTAAINTIPKTSGSVSYIAVGFIDTGTTANKIVQLDSNAKLPAVDGSQLTNLPAPAGMAKVAEGAGTQGGSPGDVTINCGFRPKFVFATRNAGATTQMGNQLLCATDTTDADGTAPTQHGRNHDTTQWVVVAPNNAGAITAFTATGFNYYVAATDNYQWWAVGE